jgi:hypothetical protein
LDDDDVKPEVADDLSAVMSRFAFATSVAAR